MNLTVVILAAGQGKRMHSNLPRCCIRLLARRSFGTSSTRHERFRQPGCASFMGTVARSSVPHCPMPTSPGRFQSPQLGTGHAVQQALPHLAGDGVTLVLYGDVPLTQAATLRRLLCGAGWPGGADGDAG